MRNFTHKITLIPASGVKYQYRQNVELDSQAVFSDVFCCSPVTFSQSSRVSEAGLCYNNTLRAVVSDPSLERFCLVPLVVRATMSDGSVVYLSSKECPAVLTFVAAGTGRYILEGSWTLDFMLDIS